MTCARGRVTGGAERAREGQASTAGGQKHAGSKATGPQERSMARHEAPDPAAPATEGTHPPPKPNAKPQTQKTTNLGGQRLGWSYMGR
jgi:hypothetical protein